MIVGQAQCYDCLLQLQPQKQPTDFSPFRFVNRRNLTCVKCTVAADYYKATCVFAMQVIIQQIINEQWSYCSPWLLISEGQHATCWMFTSWLQTNQITQSDRNNKILVVVTLCYLEKKL